MVNPKDRTEIEVETTIVRNRLIREICLHEIRLGKLMGDHYAAVCSTAKARKMIDELFTE